MKPKFLLAADRDNDRKYIVHTQNPIMVAEIIQEPNSKHCEFVIRGIDSQANLLDPKKIAWLMKRLNSWYLSVILENRNADGNR